VRTASWPGEESSLNVIGVVDLLSGRAVHARRGERERYRPVHAAPGVPLVSGDPVSLARLYVDHFGLSELYVADLDAIRGGAAQEQTVAQLTSIAPTWLDAGVSSTRAAERAGTLGVRRVIVGLETLVSFQSLVELSATIGAGRTAFSLDLNDGAPIGGSIGRGRTIEAIVDDVVKAGVGAIIVLDLARVGALAGPDIRMVSRVRSHCPTVDLIAGGGVRSTDDLISLADAGCDGVLVATALIEARLTISDLMVARERRAPARHPVER
jgi:HisA/HisF family protein